MKNYLSLRGALATKQSSDTRGKSWIASLSLAMTVVARSFRQRNELVLVGNMGKTAGLPVLLGLLDALLAGGHKIPPDMAAGLPRLPPRGQHPPAGGRLPPPGVAGAGGG